ncbi:MAG: hypothetical protein KY393_05280, partial [Actinobacteria bacterium]|nr:hypothetical protein [Actinomycetota bacterium]
RLSDVRDGRDQHAERVGRASDDLVRHRVACQRQVEQLVVAGGLNSANVGELVRTLHPWGVDVCAGVEDGPGKKDPALIRTFVRAIREAEA